MTAAEREQLRVAIDGIQRVRIAMQEEATREAKTYMARLNHLEKRLEASYRKNQELRAKLSASRKENSRLRYAARLLREREMVRV